MCNKGFKHKQLLQRHNLVHSDDRPFVCDVCGATFKTRANLYNHSNIHSEEKPYQCTFCDAKFSHKTSLILHTRWHTGEKPYSCNVCGKSFSQVFKNYYFILSIIRKLEITFRVETFKSICEYIREKSRLAAMYALNVLPHLHSIGYT